MIKKFREDHGYYGPVEIILWVIAIAFVIWLLTALLD